MAGLSLWHQGKLGGWLSSQLTVCHKGYYTKKKNRYRVFLPSSASQELISIPCSFQCLSEYANLTLCLVHKPIVYEDSFSFLARAWLHFCSHSHPHHAERIQLQSILTAYLVCTVTEWSHYEFSHSRECHRYFHRCSVVIGKYLSSGLAS